MPSSVGYNPSPVRGSYSGSGPSSARGLGTGTARGRPRACPSRLLLVEAQPKDGAAACRSRRVRVRLAAAAAAEEPGLRAAAAAGLRLRVRADSDPRKDRASSESSLISGRPIGTTVGRDGSSRRTLPGLGRNHYDQNRGGTARRGSSQRSGLGAPAGLGEWCGAAGGFRPPVRPPARRPLRAVPGVSEVDDRAGSIRRSPIAVGCGGGRAARRGALLAPEIRSATAQRRCQCVRCMLHLNVLPVQKSTLRW